jgi:hypothetical protein
VSKCGCAGPVAAGDGVARGVAETVADALVATAEGDDALVAGAGVGLVVLAAAVATGGGRVCGGDATGGRALSAGAADVDDAPHPATASRARAMAAERLRLMRSP